MEMRKEEMRKEELRKDRRRIKSAAESELTIGPQMRGIGVVSREKMEL
jgi:hypothetical protein